MDRKEFLIRTGAFCGLGLVGLPTLLESCNKTNSSTPQGPSVNFTIDLSQSGNSILNTTGGSKALHGVIIVNLAGNYIAVAQNCTHQGCALNYNAGSNNFVCPCHGGKFDTSGKVVSGPPPAPIKTYTVTKAGTVLTVVG